MKFRFSDEQIDVFRLICERDFRRSVTPHEARQMAATLFDLHEWLCDLSRSGRVDHLLKPEDADGNAAGSA